MNATIKCTIITLLVFSFSHVSGNIPKNEPADNKNYCTINDSNGQSMQISFVPYFGTSGYRSDTMSTDVSINILAGVVYEVKTFECGGMVNIDRSNVSKCQIAGIGNVVLGKSSGFQGAGTFNFSKAVDGVQVAGVINSAGSAKGLQIAGVNNHASRGNCNQIAGLLNSALDTTGFQISGIANYAPVAQIFQISGLANVAGVTSIQIAGLVNHAQKADKLQIAGLVNNTGSETKLQIAGLINNAPKIKNTQIAGLVNNANYIEGAQISGIVNRSKYFKGVQLGLINIADSCNGVPIGLLSIVRNGYHKFELSGDELFYTNFAFRSGLQKLHSILIAGIKPDNFDQPLWTYGAGMGSLFNITDNTLLGIDMTFQHIIKSSYVNNNYLYKIGTGIDLKITGKLSIYGGITYNFLVSNKSQPKYSEIYSSIAPYSFTENENSHYNLKSWAGFKVGLRFF